ncbi:hypothetical protein RBSH_01852 [Rhodopirellula baltica SH28]|nr:hypothetical protein RBSH_01852 [Rhodopirellula baltica SH28]
MDGRAPWGNEKRLVFESVCEVATMQFIELTGKSLLDVINEGEIDMGQLHEAGVNGDSILRINKFGEIELRDRHEWVLVGGLLGNFEDRLRRITQLDWL